MSDSIVIPSLYHHDSNNYSYTDSVVPSSVFTSYSLPRHHNAAPHDDEADYPLNYEASPVHDNSDNTSDAFSSSLLTSADVDNKTQFSIYGSHVKATVTESELFESRQKSQHDTSSVEYRNMKMKYLRSTGIAIPRGVAGAVAAARRLSSSPSYDTKYNEKEEEETRAARTEASPSSSPLSISPSSSSSSPAISPAPSVPKSSSVGLLARLLSERVPTAPSTPTTLSPSSSSNGLVGMSSSSHVTAVDGSSSAATVIPTYVRRTSPISIPKRASTRNDDTDGVRYRRAVQPTRDELRQQQFVDDNDNDMMDRHTAARPMVDGEFTFADVFAVPLPSSSRPIAMKKPVATGRVGGRRAPVIIAVASSASMGVSHALPSSLIDGFLAL